MIRSRADSSCMGSSPVPRTLNHVCYSGFLAKPVDMKDLEKALIGLTK